MSRSRWPGGTLLLLCGAVAFAGCTGEARNDPPAQQTHTPVTQTPAPPPGRPAIPRFDGQRAFDVLLKQTSFGPRNPGSRGHAACLEYLASTLRDLGAEVRVQKFTHAGYRGETLRLTNIVASYRPELKQRILLCAHWDTRPRAEHDPDPKRREEPILGANDGASGVAVLLEVAAALHAVPSPVGIDIALFDGEDYGMEGDHQSYLLGSRHFAASRPADYRPGFAILLDMVGDTHLEIPREGHSVRYAPQVVDLVWNAARDLGITQFVPDIGPEIIDDHLPLNEAGIPAIDIIDFDYPDPSNRFWHTHQDTPEHCSPGSLEAVGTVLLQVIYTRQP